MEDSQVNCFHWIYVIGTFITVRLFLTLCAELSTSDILEPPHGRTHYPLLTLDVLTVIQLLK
jgi:hypothetical protein